MQEFFWADRVADEIAGRKKKEYVCEGMWTPSGFFHIGNARSEIFTPYAVYMALKDRGLKARQNFILDDFDGLRKIPSGLDIKEKDYHLYLGKPCKLAPSPVKGHKSWADFFSSKALASMEDFGFNLSVISAYETYREGKFNDIIKFSLDHSKELAKVWKDVSGAEKSEGFLPVQALCSSCGSVLSTEVNAWDGRKISYFCSCGNEKTTEPYDGKAKLHWRVHWVAHWLAHKVDFESAGKDHFSKGGSVDVGRAFMKEIFRKEPPVQFPTEFILLYGKKISGSKGNIIDLGQWSEVAAPEVLRFMNFSYKPQSSIEFSLADNSFLLLMERYERSERVYYGIEKAENEKAEAKIKRAFRLSQIGKPPEKMGFRLPYSFAVQICQITDFEKDFSRVISLLKQTGHIKKELKKEDRERLKDLLLKSRFWIKNYAPDSYKVSFSEAFEQSLFSGTEPETKEAISRILEGIHKAKGPEEVQALIFSAAKLSNAKPKQVFQVLYLVLTGKKHGPKLGTLVFAFGKQRVAERLSKVLSA
jgi:lysyl-tRNA synthetase class 1